MATVTFLFRPRKWTLTRTRTGAQLTRAGFVGPGQTLAAEPDGAGGWRVPVYAGGTLVGYVAVDVVVVPPPAAGGVRFPAARFPAARFPRLGVP